MIAAYTEDVMPDQASVKEARRIMPICFGAGRVRSTERCLVGMLLHSWTMMVGVDSYITICIT